MGCNVWDFSDEELISEIEDRGYKVFIGEQDIIDEAMSIADDEALIYELENRGYVVFRDKDFDKIFEYLKVYGYEFMESENHE